jgi:hypothetical protein
VLVEQLISQSDLVTLATVVMYQSLLERPQLHLRLLVLFPLMQDLQVRRHQPVVQSHLLLVPDPVLLVVSAVLLR